MKIAISGTGGTGKTTLSTSLSNRLGFPMIPEFSRESCENLKVESPCDLTDKQVGDFQIFIIEAKVRAEREAESFVSDRGVADSLAYYLLRTIGNPHVSNLEKGQYYDLVREHIK